MPPASPTRGELARRAASRFEACFGRPPAVAAVAPGRVNLIGEHTDYNDGLVLPLAIDLHTVVVGGPAAERTSRIVADDLDERFEGSLTRGEPLRSGHWASHLIGVARLHADAGLEVPELDLLATSSLPVGGGLSSSAALEVAAALTIQRLAGHPLDERATARLCQRAEHEFVGTPCGIMDMLVALLAQRGHALLIDCRDLTVEPVPMAPAERASLLVIDTGVRHALADSAYARRRATCLEAARALDLPSLREADREMLADPRLDATQRRLATHVVSENERVRDAVRALRRGDLEALGRLLLAGHDSLRDDFEVSAPELDTLIDAARSGADAGIIGARMTGGGFGGCAIALCVAGRERDAAEHLRKAFVTAHEREPRILEVTAASRAEVLE